MSAFKGFDILYKLENYQLVEIANKHYSAYANYTNTRTALLDFILGNVYRFVTGGHSLNLTKWDNECDQHLLWILNKVGIIYEDVPPTDVLLNNTKRAYRQRKIRLDGR